MLYNSSMNITNPYKYEEYSRKSGRNGRYYVVDTERPLPSVTTILDKTADKTFLIEWRKKVGEEEAKRITQESTGVGTQMHLNLENYIQHRTPAEGNLLTKELTRLIVEKGLPKVDEVWGMEVGLYAKELYAGTTDLVGVHNGEPAIMDFKNSRKVKRKDWVEDYFLQLTAYAEAHNEMFGTNIQKGVIMMACWTGEYVEFILEGDEWTKYKDKWFDRVYAYYEKYGTS